MNNTAPNSAVEIIVKLPFGSLAEIFQFSTNKHNHWFGGSPSVFHELDSGHDVEVIHYEHDDDYMDVMHTPITINRDSFISKFPQLPCDSPVRFVEGYPSNYDMELWLQLAVLGRVAYV